MSVRETPALVAWGIVVLVAGLFAARLGSVVQGGTDAIPGSESDRVTRTLERTFGAGTLYQFVVVMRDTQATTDDPRYAETVERIERSVRALPSVHSIETAWSSDRPELLGGDWRTSLAVVTPRVSSYYQAERFTSELRGAVRRADPPPGFSAQVTGATATLHDLDERASSDLLSAERVGLPLTLAILIAVFGAPLAALLPVVLAVVAVSVALAGLYFLSSWVPVSLFAENVVSMIGLGVGVDYALFVLSRFREELDTGSAAREAARAAVRAAGHSVVFSGATVAVGFLALFLVRAPFLHAMALGGMFVVAAAVAASMTLLPALLSAFGVAVNWPRRPRPEEPPRHARVSFWTRWAETVMRRPWAFLFGAAVVLLIFVLPVLRLRAWNIGPGHLPRDTEAREGYETLASQFPRGWVGPIVAVIEARPGGTVWSPESRRAVLEMANQLSRDPRSGKVLGIPQLLAVMNAFTWRGGAQAAPPEELGAAARRTVSADGRIAMMALVTPREPGHPETMAYLRELRTRSWPDLDAAGLAVAWGGASAVMADFDDELFGSLKRVALAVMAATFVVLAFLFRSLLIPLKATVLNLLSVLAAYGFLVLVFQDGWGARWIGLEPPGGLNSFIVLMLFTILFGLSMDYEVFLLSRVREDYRATGDNARAVATGLARTGGIITSAALIMISIFASFGFTRLIPTREFGLGLAFAVALDASIIRLVLVPALMAVSGRWNWWLPGRGMG